MVMSTLLRFFAHLVYTRRFYPSDAMPIAMAICLTVCLSVCLSAYQSVCHKSVCCRNGWTSRSVFFGRKDFLTYPTLNSTKVGYLQKLGHFPPELCTRNSGLRKFRRGISWHQLCSTIVDAGSVINWTAVADSACDARPLVYHSDRQALRYDTRSYFHVRSKAEIRTEMTEPN